MSEFCLDVTLSAVWEELDDGSSFKKSHAKHITTLSVSDDTEGSAPAQFLIELAKRCINPAQQPIELIKTRVLHSLKINHNYSYIYLSETGGDGDSFDERYSRGFSLNARQPVEDWYAYIQYYPEVKVNKWYFEPEKNETGHLYLSQKQLATLLLRSSVTLDELVLNDSDHSLEHTLSVGIKQPVTIKWKNLTPKTKSNLTGLPKLFLKELYTELLKKRREHIKNNSYPKGIDSEHRVTSSIMPTRIKHLAPLIIGKYTKAQLNDIVALYHSMLSSNSGPDLFILDVACQTVKKERLVTNEELLELAETSKASGRNKRLIDYSHKEYFDNGETEIEAEKVEWTIDSKVQKLARRYREGAIARLLRSHFSVHQQEDRE